LSIRGVFGDFGFMKSSVKMVVASGLERTRSELIADPGFRHIQRPSDCLRLEIRAFL
jgi:hypothetical protein